MPSMHSLLPKLITDFPAISFTAGDRFSWSPSEHTVFYISDSNDIGLLLHELSHGLLNHHEYRKDVELVAIEAAAWEHAFTLAKHYQVTLDRDGAEANLDTYREWMHTRSICPTCEANGYQVKKGVYSCVACGSDWKVNEARLCGLRRSILTN